ncbi:putative protein TPRXL [Oryzias latipes]|uniref:putative protein TPRXL n=1 Tax=Oryzias latipes TaxID=8090 RepID=UPI000CE1DF02|nr:putative protein TPRXL [Oryzias latipes]XP_023816890.1 putative protein TPRXL [Oryzias latipes]
MKIDKALLCGLCVLVMVDSMTTSNSLTRATDAAVELGNTTQQMTTTPVTQQLPVTWTRAPNLAQVSASSSGEVVSPTGVSTTSLEESRSLNTPTTGLVILRTSGATSSSQRLFTETQDSISRSETTRAQLSYKMTVSTHKLSPTSLAASAAASETPPSLLSTSISHSDATSVVRSTSKGSTEGASLSTQNLTNSTSSGAATMVSTSRALPVSYVSMTQTSARTSLSSGPPPTRISKTSSPLSGTTGSISSPSPRWIRQVSTRSLPTSSITTSPSEKCKTTTSSSAQSCSTRGIVNKCLIAVGALAVLATIFMVSTIFLCAKLSARKQKAKRPKQSTEMMCISSLLPERHHNYTRHRNPVANGVLVFPAGGDSDEEGGDNLTLSSFLPESV